MLIKMPALSFGGGVKKFATSQAGPLCTPPSPLPCCPPTHIDSPSWQLCLPGWTAAVEILLFPSSFFLCLCFLCCPRIVPVALALRRQMDENVKPNCGQFSGAGEGGRQQKVEGTKVPSWGCTVSESSFSVAVLVPTVPVHKCRLHSHTHTNTHICMYNVCNCVCEAITSSYNDKAIKHFNNQREGIKFQSFPICKNSLPLPPAQWGR